MTKIILAIYHPYASKTPQILPVENLKEIIIGRGYECDVILHDPFISRQHARIHRDDSGIHLNDLSSRNGIKQNKKKLPNTPHPLTSGDQFQIGKTKIIFYEADHPIEPAHIMDHKLVLRDGLEHAWVSLLLLCLSVLAIAFFSWIESTEKDFWNEETGQKIIGMGLIIPILSAVCAMMNVFSSAQARFFHCISLVSIGFVLIFAYATFSQDLYFYFTHYDLEKATRTTLNVIAIVSFLLILYAMLKGRLERGCFFQILIFIILYVGFTYSDSLITNDQRKRIPHYSSSLSAYGLTHPNPVSLEHFIQGAHAIFPPEIVEKPETE